MRPCFTILIAFFLSLSLSAQSTLITNVNIWDGTSDELKNNHQVLVVDNLIQEVGQNLKVPEGAIIIDGRGNTLIPGLSDAHVHLTMTTRGGNSSDDNWMYSAIRAGIAGENFLKLGFTTVRDLGGPVFGLKRAIDENLVPGPRIFPSGAFLSQTSGHGDFRRPNDFHPRLASTVNLQEALGYTYIVDGVPEVLRGARENLKNGATQLKVMAGGGISSDYDPIHSVQFTSEELEAAVKAAADWGTYVAVHIYNPTGIIRALNAGVKCIDHGHLINEEAIKLLKEKNAWLVPQSYWTLSADPDPEMVGESRYKKIMEVRSGAINEMVLAKKYEVNMAYGSDAFGPLGGEFRALNEFTSRVRWFTPLEVLKQATSGNAELFKLSGKLHPYTEGKLGVIAKGAYADLLIYTGNPLEDIEVIVNYKENLKFIMKDGSVYQNHLE